MANPKSLEEYKKKRNFQQTSEPSGDNISHDEKNLFVIQKHDASNLHYDFRIRIGDVLKSWAVPKGPSTDHNENRLAMETEDHPVDYADFEGTIPEDEYGGGTVLIWDRGTYKNLREEKEDDNMSMQESYEDGKIEIWLEGKKLRGGYVLIHTKKNDKDNRWMLKKMKDDESDARRNPVSTEPDSVISGDSLKDIEKKAKKND